MCGQFDDPTQHDAQGVPTVATTTTVSTYDTEASTLGLRPGEWPDRLEYEEAEFRLEHVESTADGIAWVDYRECACGKPHPDGHLLRVWND